MIRPVSYLLFTVLTWYLAGMYRSRPLTVLFLAESVLFFLMLLQAVSFHLTFSAGFPSDLAAGEKLTECRCRIFVCQKGWFPAGRVRLTLSACYADGRQIMLRRLFAGAEPGKRTELEYFLRPALCGPVRVELCRWRVYDSLSLFSAGRRCHEHMTLAVFPRPRALSIQYAVPPETPDHPGGGSIFLPRGEPAPEFRSLREYQPGDSARMIHWKQSARTDQLWIRESEQEAEGVFTLALDRSGGEHLRAEVWDAFYEILSALVLGLLEHAAAVRVFWRGGGQVFSYDISDETSRREFFLRLYHTAPQTNTAPGKRRGQNAAPEKSRGQNAGTKKQYVQNISHEMPSGSVGTDSAGFAFDTRLRWRCRDRLIYQFSPGAWPEEIAGKTFSL